MEKSVSFNIRLPDNWVGILKTIAKDAGAYGAQTTPSGVARHAIRKFLVEHDYIDKESGYGKPRAVSMGGEPRAPGTRSVLNPSAETPTPPKPTETFKHRHCWEFPVPHAHKTCCDCNARKS